MKKLFYFLLVVVIVIAVGIVALITFVNPNQFKPLIVEQVKKATGRDLVISGDLHWRFFPTLGMSLGETEFKNPQGFSEPNLLSFSKADLSVSVMPLFSHQLDVGDIQLHNAKVFIETKSDGVSNLDGLEGNTVSPESAESAAIATNPMVRDNSEPADASSSKWKVNIAGISLVNASAQINNQKTDSHIQVNDLNVHLSHFTPGQWATLTLSTDGQANDTQFQFQANTQLLLGDNFKKIELKGLSISGALNTPTTSISQFSVSMPTFTLDQWSSLNYRLVGKSKTNTFDVNGQTQLNINQNGNVTQLKNLELQGTVAGNDVPNGQLPFNLRVSARYNAEDALAQVSQISLDANETQVTGSGSVQFSAIPKIRFILNSPSINLANWQAQTSTNTTSVNTQVEDADTQSQATTTPNTETSPVILDGSTSLSTQELDLSALKNLDVHGQINVDQLLVNNLTVNKVSAVMQVQKGILDLSRLQANVYGGQLNSTLNLNTNGTLPQYKINTQLNGVQIQPMLKALLNKDVLSGVGQMQVNLSGQGLSPLVLRQAIQGTVNIQLADGQIYGVNIPQMIREAKAKLKGESLPVDTTPKTTDFSGLGALFTLNDGIASTNNLHLDSPLLRVKGQGETNLVNESLNMQINTSVVATSTGQGGKDLSDLAGLTVPINVQGQWRAPTYGLNLKALFSQNNELKNKAEKEVDRGINKLFGDSPKAEKLKDAASQLLKGLFN